ncbi:MAG: TonB-dependent receptor [Bacteroidota bacterium]
MKNIKILILILFVLTCQLLAAGSGKISGIIIDAATDEPLLGANIVILNTNYGAATDVNGKFIIVGIEPNIYSVKVSSIGYQSKVINNVKVMSELTTEVNVTLTVQSIEMDEEVVVEAKRPVVQKDLTSTRVIVDGKKIVEELRAQSLSQVIELQPGVTLGTDGRFHVRGGRAGGSVVMVDGIPLLNPFTRTTGGEIEVESIQEFQALLGTFDAEYGNAADGIINISTRDGRSKYSMKVMYESPQLNASPYHEKDWNLNRSDIKDLSPEEQEAYKDVVRKPDGTSAYDFVSALDDPYAEKYLPVKALGTFLFNFSGPVPFTNNILSFYVNARMRNEDSPLPWGYDLYKSALGKLTFLPLPTTQIRFTYNWTQRAELDYNHTYKYWRWFDSELDTLGRRGGYPMDESKSNRQVLNFKQVLSNETFFDLTLARIYDYYDEIVPDRNVVYDETTGDLISSDYYTRLYVNGLDGNFRYGDVRYWRKTENLQYMVKGNFESQFTKNHLLRTGFDFKHHEINRHRIGMPPRSNLEYFTYKPIEAAFYIQDKIEYDFMILKLGLRMDYFDPQASAYPDPSNILEIYDNNGTAEYRAVDKIPVEPHIQISPRIGLAHPISDKTSIYFAYGHFFQIPRFYDLYRDHELSDILVNDALVGNPSIKPEKTVSFEVGLQHELTEDWGLNLTAYTKDISNLISSQYYFVGRDYTTFTNADFGTVRGIDLTLDKHFSNFYNFRLTYSLMSAMGNQSDPTEGYTYREDQAHLRPNRNYPLDFDQTHKLVSFFTVRLPKDYGGPIFELLTFNTVFTVGSGLPYTPTSREADESNIVPEPNSGRRPWTYNLDFRMSKEIPMGIINLTLYMNAENVLDTENTRFIWSRTGEALSEGPTSIRPFDRQANPANLYPRRSVRLGLYIHF